MFKERRRKNKGREKGGCGGGREKNNDGKNNFIAEAIGPYYKLLLLLTKHKIKQK